VIVQITDLPASAGLRGPPFGGLRRFYCWAVRFPSRLDAPRWRNVRLSHAAAPRIAVPNLRAVGFRDWVVSAMAAFQHRSVVRSGKAGHSAVSLRP
jgi:hypothetical protein